MRFAALTSQTMRDARSEQHSPKVASSVQSGQTSTNVCLTVSHVPASLCNVSYVVYMYASLYACMYVCVCVCVCVRAGLPRASVPVSCFVCVCVCVCVCSRVRVLLFAKRTHTPTPRTYLYPDACTGTQAPSVVTGADTVRWGHRCRMRAHSSSCLQHSAILTESAPVSKHSQQPKARNYAAPRHCKHLGRVCVHIRTPSPRYVQLNRICACDVQTMRLISQQT
jgi:hypothetical protein